MNIFNEDYELWEIIKQEEIRQEKQINLIASENYASYQTMRAQGSVLTNKYAEGYPSSRYYTGCEYIDKVERLAIDRAKTLFNADYANVQPHSGSQANFAVYSALAVPGSTILSMNLKHGGHLTHGSSSNFSGKLYNFLFYNLKKNGNIDYEQICYLANKYNPKIIVGGFSSYSGIVDWRKIREISDNVGAYFLADMSHIAGLVAARLYPSPLPFAHVVTSTTHKTLSGPRGGLILSKNGDKNFYKKLDSSVFPGTQGGPLMHVIAAKAVALKEAMNPEFIDYQRRIIENAKCMVNIFLDRKFKVVSGDISNHMFLLDLTEKNMTGEKASIILEKSNIITNKNCIPNDINSPVITSGLRIGTQAVTNRGFKKKDVCNVAEWICDVIENNNYTTISNVREKVIKLCGFYPVYKNVTENSY